jgi:hypothetical protein
VTDILFVSTDTVRIDHWHRQGDAWIVAFRGSGDRVELSPLGAVIDLDELYRDLPLEADEPLPT